VFVFGTESPSFSPPERFSGSLRLGLESVLRLTDRRPKAADGSSHRGSC
jgi:hypothetical protein